MTATSVRQNAFEVLVQFWPIFKGKHRLIKVLSKLLKIGPYGFCKSKHIGNYTLLLDPGDVNDQLFYFSLIGSGYEQLMQRLLQPGDCVIDGGANIGHFSVVCANLVGYKGAVHAIEASPHMFCRLRSVFRDSSHGPVRVHPYAIAEECGTVPFHVATVSGWSSLLENETFKTVERIEVPAISLDTFCQKRQISHVRVLKLDIEGGETDALLGGSGILASQAVDFILLEAEANRLRAFKHTGHEIVAIMNKYGYEPVCTIYRERISPVNESTAIPGYFNGDWLYVRHQLFDDAYHSIFGHDIQHAGVLGNRGRAKVSCSSRP